VVAGVLEECLGGVVPELNKMKKKMVGVDVRVGERGKKEFILVVSDENETEATQTNESTATENRKTRTQNNINMRAFSRQSLTGLRLVRPSPVNPTRITLQCSMGMPNASHCTETGEAA